MTCVPDLIRMRIAERPDAVAAVDPHSTLTYAELDRASARLGARLTRQGVSLEHLVGICLAPSVELVIAILAVWRAGAAYVAVDPAWPRARQRELLEEAGIQLTLVDTASAAALEETGLPVAIVEAADQALEADRPRPGVEPTSLAYVLFTSGSTGRPKGVMIEHRQLAAYVKAASSSYAFPPGAQFLLSSTVAADLGHTPLFCSLCTGGTLYLVPPALATDPDGLGTYVLTRRIDVIKVVPSHLMTLVSNATVPASLMPRTHVVLGGETLQRRVVETVERLRPGLSVINEYGPTETTVGVSACRVSTVPSEGSDPVSAGHPLGGSTFHVLSPKLEPIPHGQTGEVYIGGVTVGRGYRADPALTASRFVPDPFVPGGRLYRSGDLGRILADGSIEILGRIDAQVKIRGFRVEPREVEAALLRCGGVHAAFVEAEAGQEGSLRLVAYVAVGDAHDSRPTRDRLVDEIEARLPAPMVPAVVVTLRELPLTANGKVDRDTLRSGARTRTHVYVAPETDAERALATVWSQVLNVPRVGRNDSFFRLGGDSILMIKAATLASRLGYAINARLIFKHPVLKDLADAVVPGPPGGPAPEPRP